MKIRLPLLLRRMILTAMLTASSVWTVFASESESGNTRELAEHTERMDAAELSRDMFKWMEASFFSLEKDNVSDFLLPEERNLAYHVPALNETIEFREPPSGISVIENAGLGNLQFKDGFFDFNGTLKATAGGTLTFLIDASFTLLAGIELSHGSTLICDARGVEDTILGAISGQGFIIKRGDSRTVYFGDVSQKFDGDIIIEKGAIRLGEKSKNFEETGYVFGEGSTGNFIIKNDALLTLRYGRKFYFSQNFMMEDGSCLQIYEATGNIIYGNFFVGSATEGNAAKGVLLDLRRQTDLSLSGGLSGNSDAVLLISNEEEVGHVSGDRDIILDGDVSLASERFAGTIRIYPHAGQDGSFNFYLNHAMAASGALFDLSGIDNNKMSVLKVGVVEAVIRGLNGTAFTRVEGVGGMRTLVLDAGNFAGEVGTNLSLKKQGAGTLFLSGANKDFAGDVTVTGGVLHFSLANNRDYTGNIKVSGGTFHFSIAGNKAFSQNMNVSGGTLDLSVTNNKINSVLLGNGAHFILNGSGVIAGSLTGNGKLIKEGTGTLEFAKTSTCAFEGDVEIREGILKIQTAGADGTDAYVLSTQNSMTGTITLSKDTQLIFNDGTPRSRLLVNKQVVLEDGASIKIVNGISFGALFKEAVVFQKGIKVKDGVATILFDQDRLVRVQGLNGKGVFKVEDTLSGMWSRPRILDLSGEGDFEGEILVTSIKKDKEAYVNVRLKEENAAKKAVINLQGQAYGTGNSVSSRLTLVAETATIAGLTGNQYSALASFDDQLRTLVVNGGGTFAGFLGENLSLTKSGNDSTLTLTGANSSMTEKIKVAGGTLAFTSTYGQINSDLELSNGAFLSLVADTADLTLAKSVSGTGNIIKMGRHVLNMTNAAGELDGDILVKEGILALSGSGIVGNIFGKGKAGNISVSDGAAFRLDGGSGYIIDKNFRMEDGSRFCLNSAGDIVIKGMFEVQKARTGEEGVVFEFSDLLGNRTVSLAGGLSGSGTFILQASGSGGSGVHVVSLDGDVSSGMSRFSGVIEVGANGESGKGGAVTLVLNDSLAASEATIRLFSKDIGASCLPVLRIGATKVTIAGLNGDASSLVEGAEGAEHTLVVNGGGNFAGTFGGNLVLVKSGEGVLNLTGTSSSFGGTVKVTGGILNIGERAKDAGGKMTVDVNGGTLQLDNTAVLGNVNLSSGTFDFAHEGSSVDMVTISGGEMKASANGSLLSLRITGSGLVTVSSDGLAVSSLNPVSVSEQGKVVFSGNGLLAGGVQLNLSGAGAVAEIAKSEDNTFSTVLLGDGIFRISHNSSGVSTTYSGNSDLFTGTVEINAGKLALSGSLRQASVRVKDGSLLELRGADQQVKQLLGNTGKVCFSNSSARITDKSLFASYGGTLLLDRNQRVTFSRTSQEGKGLMGGFLTLEFRGGNGELVLDNSFTGIMNESVRDIVLGSPGTIVLSGGNVSLRLNGSSWYGEVAAGNTLLLRAGTNNFYVDPALNENLLLNVRLEVTEVTGDTVSGGVRIDSTGKLLVNVPLELLSSPFMANADQSYKISRDNSKTDGELSFRQDTLVRDLIIYAGREEGHVNTGIVLDKAALKLKMGRLIISGDADYAISGGSLGFLDRAEDPSKAEFLISQESAGTVTVSSDWDSTIHLLNKGGEGDLVLSGKLKNTGGIYVESGKLTLTGSSDKIANAWLTNKGELILGDGKSIYIVNYAGLRASEGSETTFDDKTSLDSGFIVRNAGKVRFATGGSLMLDTAITGYNDRTGVTFLSNNTSLTLPQGGDQNYTVAQGSSLTWNMSEAIATGGLMTGDGQINLHNVTDGALDLRGIAMGTGWSGFTGTLAVTGSQPVILELGCLGNGATVILSAGSTLVDKAEGGDARSYNITLGDNAAWLIADTNRVTYRGTLTLGSTGTLTGSGKEYSLESDITGGTLRLSGGTYRLGGNNTHALTHVGANTTVVGSTPNAFGKGILLDQEGSLARVTGAVITGTLTGNEKGLLDLVEDGCLTVTHGTDWRGDIAGNGTLILGGTSTLAGGSGNFSGMLNVRNDSHLTLGATLGTASIHIGQGATLDITGNNGLTDNAITLGAGSTLIGGETYNGKLGITGNQYQETVTGTGNLNLDTLHLNDANAKLTVTGNLTVTNGGRLVLSDANAQDTSDALVSVDGYATLGGIFDLILDVNNTFAGGEETQNYTLFKAQGGLNITTDGNATRLKLDASLEEFFTLNQNDFKNTGIVSVTRKEMICYLLDPIHVGEGGDYYDGYVSVNNVSYLGANAANGTGDYPSLFHFDRKYTIAQGDNAYRLTSGDAWMNFHVKMTDTQIGAPTKLVIRENWRSASDESGILLSVRGSADDTYTGGTQIYQAKVKIDGTRNDQGVDGGSTLENGDVCFLGTGRVELTGAKAALILNTGGDNSKGKYTWNNDILLQQGAMIEQTSSNNILAGSITIADNAILRNTSGQTLTLSGKNITGNQLEIQGNGNAVSPRNTIELVTVNGDKVNASLTLADVSRNAHFIIGQESMASIVSLVLDKDSQVSVTLGGTLALKEVRNGINGAGVISLECGTFKVMDNYTIAENGILHNVAGTRENLATMDTSGYCVEVNQDISGWNWFQITGGGRLALNYNMSEASQLNGMVTGKGTIVSIEKDKNLSGTWTVKDGGTLQTKENVSISGTLNIEAGGKTDFGQGTWMDNAKINLRSGATYSGFLNGNGATITFENGSHFQVKTEDLRKLTEMSGTPNAALLSADTINIQNGNGFFRFTGGDGIVNDALLDACQTKTLIYGKENLTVGGLGGTTTATAAHDLTDQQLAAMIGDNTYRWLTFQLTADKTGDTGSKLNLTVTRHVNFGELAQTANQAAIAPTLSHIGMQGGKTDSTLIGEQLNQLGLALTKATDNAGQMLSNISLSTSSVLNGYTVQRENLRRHTYDLRDRAVQERPCALRHQYETLENTLWANGIGATYTVDGDNNAVGHTTSQWGGQLGMSRCINDNLVMGIAFTYTDSELTLDQSMGKATSSAYYIDLYAKYHKDNWNLTGVLTGGITDLDTTRHMNIPGYSSTTTGSSTGNQIMGLVELGYEIDLYGDRSNILEPFATLNAGYSTIDSFREKGAGTAGLDIASQNMASASLGAGLRYVKEYSAGNDNLQKGRFEIRAMIFQDLTDTATDIEARFIGAPGQNFTQKSVEPGKTGLLLGTGIVIPATLNLSLFADLDGEFRDSETGCRANIGLKYAF